MSVAEELQKLQQLRQTGVITEDEFATAKAAILSGLAAPGSPQFVVVDEESADREARMWGMCLHLSMFAGYLVPFAGLIVPIVIWQVKKDQVRDIDAHGKNAVNWIISVCIYIVACIPLMFVLIGIPLLMVVGLLGIVFPIIAAIKASNGDVWRYPLSIPFFR